MTTGVFEIDYADMQATADGFQAIAEDLRACLLGTIPSGVDVYGYPVLADAVDRLAEALRTRHTAVADATETVGDLLEACRWGYQKVDEAAAVLMEARLRVMDAMSQSTTGPAGQARPV